MKVINIGFLRCKFLECRISSIEERIDKLQDLSLFYQSRFNNGRSDRIKNKIAFLNKRKVDLMAVFNRTQDNVWRKPGIFLSVMSLMKNREIAGENMKILP